MRVLMHGIPRGSSYDDSRGKAMFQGSRIERKPGRKSQKSQNTKPEKILKTWSSNWTSGRIERTLKRPPKAAARSKWQNPPSVNDLRGRLSDRPNRPPVQFVLQKCSFESFVPQACSNASLTNFSTCFWLIMILTSCRTSDLIPETLDACLGPILLAIDQVLWL